MHAAAALGLVGNEVVYLERLGDHLADGHLRIERLVRVLEDHLDVAAQGFLFFALGVRDIVALEDDLAGRWRFQSQQRQRQRRFAAAALADDGQNLAPAEVKTDIVHCMNKALRRAKQARALRLEQLAQVADLEDWVVGHGYQ